MHQTSRQSSNRPRAAALFLALALAGSGCRPSQPGVSAGLPSNATTHTVTGTLREVRNEGSLVIIDHDEIPGFMAAMTMPFDVRHPDEIEGLVPGDRLEFNLIVTPDDAWIDQVRRVGRDESFAAAPPVPPAPEDLLRIGATVPDCLLTNQSGHLVQLEDFQGGALAVTFFFTSCPLPDYCPRMSRHFAEVQRLMLQADPNGRWHLLSISFDPDRDTPERLAAYGRSHGQRSDRWTLATGDAGVVRSFGARFGLLVRATSGSFDHNLRTAVIAPDGTLQALFADNNWQPAELVEALQAATGREEQP